MKCLSCLHGLIIDLLLLLLLLLPLLLLLLLLPSAVIGELDEELDSQVDLSEIKADPLKPVVH